MRRNFVITALLCLFSVRSLGDAGDGTSSVGSPEAIRLPASTAATTSKSEIKTGFSSLLSKVILKTLVSASSDVSSDRPKNPQIGTYRFVGGYKLNPDWKILSLFGSNVRTNQTSQMIDTIVSLRRSPISLSNRVSLSPSFGAIIPFSQRSTDTYGLQTEARAGSQFFLDLSKTDSQWKYFSAFFEPSVALDLNNVPGSANPSKVPSQRVQNWLNLKYGFLPKWRLSADSVYSYVWTKTDDSFGYLSFDQAICYLPNPDTIISFGRSSGGTLIGAEGTDTSLRQSFSPDSSDFFLSVVYNWL